MDEFSESNPLTRWASLEGKDCSAAVESEGINKVINDITLMASFIDIGDFSRECKSYAGIERLFKPSYCTPRFEGCTRPS